MNPFDSMVRYGAVRCGAVRYNNNVFDITEIHTTIADDLCIVSLFSAGLQKYYKSVMHIMLVMLLNLMCIDVLQMHS